MAGVAIRALADADGQLERALTGPELGYARARALPTSFNVPVLPVRRGVEDDAVQG